ncbi:hypothetical protein CpipJ_CPIJ010435 [Culex quinquefasciatus]|uniref:Uncharacterized protein n=1 Tax=Culex quinquefasciatus TaxID=7176 RepID=B0WT16_CULQU|nr:hypothetical protein CpipJ_CPIJ010435 [Culex quinquefasciatus]|eukprot:XP_001870778.1 hypothetical protein CpipJ_CPIJ010435 [Culex quinquefasciatus]
MYHEIRNNVISHDTTVPLSLKTDQFQFRPVIAVSPGKTKTTSAFGICEGRPQPATPGVSDAPARTTHRKSID